MEGFAKGGDSAERHELKILQGADTQPLMKGLSFIRASCFLVLGKDETLGLESKNS